MFDDAASYQDQSFDDTVQGQRRRIECDLRDKRPVRYNELTEAGKIAAQTLADEEKVKLEPKQEGVFVVKRDKGLIMKFLTASFY